MAAKTGVPVRQALNFKDGSVPFEIQEPAAGALFAVCPDCGFEFDADHTVNDVRGREGYECPRCALTPVADALEAMIERVEDAAPKLVELANLRKEVEHLRPQNCLLKEENEKMRDRLREIAVKKSEGQWRCACCGYTWPTWAKEYHQRGCLAEASQ